MFCSSMPRRSTIPGLVLLALASTLAWAQGSSPAAGSPRAAEAKRDLVTWRGFGPAAFRRAQNEDRLILLVLEVPWSEYSGRARKETWSDPTVAQVIKEHFVAIRERADLRPDLTRRYPAEGWPAVTVLLPDGAPLYMKEEASGRQRRVTSGYRPGPSMAGLLSVAAQFYRARREEAIAMAREEEKAIRGSLRPTPGPIGESLTWALVTQIESTFDKEHRYFGGPPRLPRLDLIELMLNTAAEKGEDSYRVLGFSALDTLRAHLVDPEDGGLYRMALGLDWERPQREKLLDRNARFLDLLTLRYRISGKKSDRKAVAASAKFITTKLNNADGSFSSAVCESCAGGIERTVLTGANAMAASALIRAGAATGDPALVERGLAAARFLKTKRWRAGRGLPHAVVDGLAMPPGTPVLDDLAESAGAFLTAYEATGEASWLEAARDVARTALSNLRDSKTGALADIIPSPSGPIPLREAIYPMHANARLARVLIRLHYESGEDRTFLAGARDVLNAFGKSFDRVALFVPAYALALYEFHFAPEMAVVVARSGDPRGSELRQAAMGAVFPFTVVRSMDPATQREDILAAGLSIGAKAGLYPFYDGLGARRIEAADTVRAGLYDLRLLRLEQRSAIDRKSKGRKTP